MLATTRRIFRFRELLTTLAGRELKARYRGSLLGFVWSLLNPLLLLAVYTFVFNFIFKPRVEGAEPYALFLMTGLFPWMWISGSLLEGSESLLSNAGLIRKAVFPVEVLPTVSVVSNLVHFLLALPVMVGGFLVGRWLGYPVGGWEAVLLPVVLALMAPVVAGCALLLAALNAHFKDVKDILANLLALGFYLTPIIYPLDWIKIPALHWVVLWLNPFTVFITAVQDLLFRGVVPGLGLWLHMAGWALVAWGVGAFLFERMRDSLVEAV